MEPGVKTVAKRGKFIQLTEAQMSVARMRHAWYRRSREGQLQIAAIIQHVQERNIHVD